MRRFVQALGVSPGQRILDVGGKARFWEELDIPVDITILNLPGELGARAPSVRGITYVEADGCHMPQYKDAEFDIAFSNSVIEHVGDEDRQRAFASEIRRVGKAYWVQTPAIWFPLEPHARMPFWWFYPEALRRALLGRWRERLPEWTDMVEGTRVLSQRQLRDYFPDGVLWVERLLGVPKSYCCYRTT
jgi:hypothetical protein